MLGLHSTDATALTDAEAPGIEVTVPANEFERLDAWIEDGRFGEYEVYRAETGRVFLLVVARDETGRRMVCVPAHYGFEPVSALADRAGAEGRIAEGRIPVARARTRRRTGDVHPRGSRPVPPGRRAEIGKHERRQRSTRGSAGRERPHPRFRIRRRMSPRRPGERGPRYRVTGSKFEIRLRDS